MAAASAPSITNNTSPSKSKYRPEIDGLRAFAVVAVIINHFNKDLLPSGYLGVDIFFVISGYVITSSLAGRESKNFLDFLTGFYERRIKRLVPALVVFVLITSVLISLFNPNPGTALKTGASSLIGLSNLILFQGSTDYFSESTELNPFTHTWSLGVEEQFYLLFPFLIWFSGFGQQKVKGARNLFFWVGTLTIASLISFIYLYQVNQPAAYFLMPPRFWEMAAGCLIFIGFQKRAKIEQVLEQVPPLLVVAAMLGVMFLPTEAAVPATISIVALSAVLIACLKKGTAAYGFFTLEKVVYVGLISYSLYLWHWSVLSISRWTIGIHWWSTPFIVLMMLAFAIFGYRNIELPCRRSNKKIFTKGFLAKGFSAIVFAYCLSFVNWRYLAPSIVSSENIETWWKDKDDRYIEYCHIKEAFSLQVMSDCLKSGSPRNIPNGFLIGDSHARNYLNAAKDAFPEYSINYLTMGHGCAFLPSSMIYDALESKVKCSKYVKEVTKFIQAEAKTGDIVLIGQSLVGDLSFRRSTPAYFDHIQAFAKSLEAKGVPIVIFDGTSPPSETPELCTKELWRPFPDAKKCLKPIQVVNNAYSKFDRMASRLSAVNQNVFFAPIRLGLCIDQTCGQYTSIGTPIWHDYGHITDKASGELAQLLRSKLRSNGFYAYLELAQERNDSNR